MLEHLVVDGTTLQFVMAAGMGLFSFNFEGYEAYLDALFMAVVAVHVFVCSHAGGSLRKGERGSHGTATSRCAECSVWTVWFGWPAEVAVRGQQSGRQVMASAAASAQPYAEEYRLLVAYEAAGLVNDSKKTFGSSLCSDLWCIDIDSDSGVFRALQMMKSPAMMITFWACFMELSEVGTFMASAGTWESMLGVTSRYYACMCLLAETPSMNCRPLRVIGISVVLKLVLMALAAMASFLVVNLWAKFGSFVASIVASFTAMAGVSAQTVSADAAGVATRNLWRGNWTMLLRSGRALIYARCREDPESGVPYQKYCCIPFREVMAKAFTFRACWHGRIRSLQHFCVCALQFPTDERRSANFLHGASSLAEDDRDVALGVFAEGSAFPLELDAVVLPALPFALGAGAVFFLKHLSLAPNSCDAPTQESEPFGTVMGRLSRAYDFTQGYFLTADVWMRTLGAFCGKLHLPFCVTCWPFDFCPKTMAAQQSEVWRAMQGSKNVFCNSFYFNASLYSVDGKQHESKTPQALSPAHCKRGARGSRLEVFGDNCHSGFVWAAVEGAESVEGAYSLAESGRIWWLSQRRWKSRRLLWPQHGSRHSFSFFDAPWWKSMTFTASKCKAEKLDVAGCSKTGSLRELGKLHAQDHEEEMLLCAWEPFQMCSC